MKKVFLNGYGSIGGRIAKFIKDDPDIDIIGIGKHSSDEKVQRVIDDGFFVYVPENKIDNFKILVVGECYGDENKYIQLAEDNGVSDVIDFRFEFVPNEKVNQYFCAADLVALPYKSATQSGVVPIAYHFDIPVVVSNVGGLPEVVVDGETGFICEPNPNSIADSIVKYFNMNPYFFSQNINEYKKRFSWDNFVKVVLELVES